MNKLYIRARRVSHTVVYTLCIAYALICMTKNCFSSAMVFIVEEGILTKTQTGIITGLFYVVYGILQIAGGMVADRFDATRFVTFGLAGAGIINMIIYFNQSYSVMLTAWSVNAVVQFAVWPSVFKILTTMPERGFRTKSIFIATFSNPIGVIMSYLVAAIVPRWQHNFLVSGIVMFAIASIWHVVSVVGKKNLVEEDDLPEYSEEKNHSGDFNLFKTIFTSGIAFVLVVTFIRTMFDLGIKSLVPVMINESYEEVSASFATVLSTIVLVAGVVGIITAGNIYANKFKNEITAVAVMFAISVPLICITLLIGKINYMLIVICLALIVMLMSSAGYFTTTYISIRFNKWGKGATVSGIFNCLASLGIVAANIVFTAMADNFGWIFTIKSWVIMGIAGTVLACAAIPLWAKFIKKQEETSPKSSE